MAVYANMLLDLEGAQEACDAAEALVPMDVRVGEMQAIIRRTHHKAGIQRNRPSTSGEVLPLKDPPQDCLLPLFAVVRLGPVLPQDPTNSLWINASFVSFFHHLCVCGCVSTGLLSSDLCLMFKQIIAASCGCMCCW